MVIIEALLLPTPDRHFKWTLATFRVANSFQFIAQCRPVGCDDRIHELKVKQIAS